MVNTSKNEKTVLRNTTKETPDVKTSSVEVKDVTESAKFSCLTAGNSINFADNNSSEVKLLSSLQHEGKPIFQGFTEDGKNIFGGNLSATRSQVLKTLMVSGCIPSEVNSNQQNPYDDISKQDWHYNFILAATSKAIVEGYKEKSGRTFKPDRVITRIEALKMISLISGIKKAPENCDSNPFTDIDTNHWGFEISRDAYCSNLVVGKTIDEKRYLFPDEELLRSDLAIWLYNSVAINTK